MSPARPAIADVAIVGGGPAAFAAVASCVAAGLDVVRIGPISPWIPTYGCWLDELEALDLADAAGRVLTEVTAIGHREHRIDRAYAVVDNDGLASELRSRAPDVRSLAEPVVRHRLDGDHHVLTTATTEVTALAVVDATGHAPALVWRRPIRSVAVQAAFGIVARTVRPAVGAGGCRLMDWRPAPGADPRTPSFLYVLDLGDGWTLLEETSLAAAPAVSRGELRRRLHSRTESFGLGEVRHTEHVAIPMNLPVPPPQAVIGFGAAGGFVHPATGYSLIASLRLAPRLAEAIVAGLDAGGRGGELGVGVWATLWSPAALGARALHEYGLGVLLGLDQAATAAFFDTFFELPAEAQAAYVDPVADRRRLVAVMREMFAAAPWSVRRRLMAGDLRRLVTAARGG